VVGQEVEIKNAFYDSHEDEVSSMRKEYESTLIKTDSIDVFELMGSLIEAEDISGIDYLVSLIIMADPIDDVNFDEKTNDRLQIARRVYYYDESDESKFEKKKVDDDIIYSLPTMFVTKEAEEQRQSGDKKHAGYDTKLLSENLKVYFKSGKSDLSPEYEKYLDDILAILEKNPDLGVEISGYASPEGDEEYNRQLSNNRAISVLNYLNHRGIVRRRIVAKGFGETFSGELSNEELRRVDVNIISIE
jgi:outer membrane protein OmpA-like peptidoglycan-associated protein